LTTTYKLYILWLNVFIFEEICTSDYHKDNCDCFAKQEQKIKELQAELERQRKIQEEKKQKQEDE